jgi:hypothetical protein
MSANNKINIKELAELAIFLYKEGAKHQQQSQYDHAAIRYTQSLHFFKSLGRPNLVWNAALLHNIGTIRIHEQQEKQALPFLSASTRILRAAGESEDIADWSMKQALAYAGLSYYSQADDAFRRASSIYKNLGLGHQSDLANEEIRKLNLASSAPKNLSDQNHPITFIIQVDGVASDKLVVTNQGNPVWETLAFPTQPRPLRLEGWQIDNVDFE